MNYFWDIDMFSDISESDQQQLSDFCQVQDFTLGEIVFQEGDDPQALYIVRQGDFLVAKSDGSQATLTPGDIVGEMALYSGENTRRNATVTSQGDGQLIIILQFSLDQMLKKYPALHQMLLDTIAARQQENALIDEEK